MAQTFYKHSCEKTFVQTTCAMATEFSHGFTMNDDDHVRLRLALTPE